ncbi:class I SAM-dependent methyltransferase [Candidatus Thioglobus autotrophicus]|jgi:SAM-dependent methyltransferase|uniref:class I SAM-dependent methyltransferase n=1 Tax=Candidatus Thioglobus autotrophicus TaxID=1705394 RepID=UPI00299EC59B|nr:class I SAM-dependent methyltransferase [Candidatus Thioglobus autotrophicus]WPE17176.1 class I SAM-dependent methyltransferase [Candidatus Thioglobus autotrophicus]
MAEIYTCPLCSSKQVWSYYSNENSSYWRCSKCELVFLPKRFHLNNIDEKSRYDLHQNNPNDVGYRRFLSTIFNAVEKHLKPHAKGLDFGCGPGPTLSLMFAEKGYSVDLFDKFYADNPDIFNNQYDFITATEVAEHLQAPGQELSRLYDMLKPGGVLAIMTSMLNKGIDFSTWHYKNDPTHICFFNQTGMQHLAKKWGANVEFVGSDIGLFFK